MRKIVVFPTDPVEVYARKGEVKEGYYNPENYFDEVHIITFSKKDPEIDYNKIGRMCGSANYTLHYVGPFSFAKIAELKRKTSRIVGSLHPDLVRAYDMLFQGYFASEAAKKSHIPFVLSLHDNYQEYFTYALTFDKNVPKWFFFKLWKWFYLGSIINAADYIIAAHPHAIRGIPVSFDRPHAVVYNKVYASKFKPLAVGKPKEFTAVTVANLIYMKGIDRLIDAVKGTDIKLVIVGKGPLKDTLVTQARANNVQGQVTFIDSIPNEQLPEFYNKAHCFVTGVRQGGIGIPMLEAMACKIPMVYTQPDCKEPPDLYDGKNMLLVHGEGDAVRKGLLKFKHDQALRKRIANAAFATFSRIEGKKMEKQEADVYRKLLRKQ